MPYRAAAHLGCRRLTTTTGRSDHILLAQRLVLKHPGHRERREIEGAVIAMRDQLRYGAADGGGLLHAVAAEAAGAVEVVEIGMRTDQTVLVEGIVIIVPGPG